MICRKFSLNPNNFFAECVRVLPGSFVLNQPLDTPVEQFISALRFENWGKLDELGIENKMKTLSNP